MQELLDQLPDAAEATQEPALQDAASLRQGDTDLIAALLVTRTIRDAARLAGIGEATVYRRMKDAAFQRAWREAKQRYHQETIDGLARRERVKQALQCRVSLLETQGGKK
jgi:hypothetical protein